MTKKEFVSRIQTAMDCTTAQAEKTLESISYIMWVELLGGGEVPLPGLGKLKASKVKPRTGRNPRTGEAISLPASLRVSFGPGKYLKEALKN